MKLLRIASFSWIYNYTGIVLIVLQSAVSVQQVFIIPSGHVAFPLTGQATIDCLPSFIIESVQWLVNGTDLVELNLTNVEIINYGGIEVLNISNITVELNMTTIQCVITLDMGGGRVSSHHSDITTLMVQGLLDNTIPVISYNSTISLTWTAPFSLDITDVDPDITYCVDVVDSTSMSTLHSQCGLIDTGFNYSIPSSGVCGDYAFTITPVNVVGNGTSATVQYSQALTAPRASEQQLMPLSSMDGVYTYHMALSSVVCESELTFEDVDTGEETRLGDSDLIISNNIIMFTTAQLNTNRLYSVSVSASNPSGSALSNTSLGTHDVVETFIEKSRESNMVHVTVMYAGNSSATGALLIFLFVSDSAVDFKQSSYVLQNRSTDLLSGLPPGSYTLLVYDIESTGVLKNGVGYPATTDKFVIRGINQKTISMLSSPHITSCNVTSTPDRVVFVLCIYTRIVTGFQIIVQNSDLDKVHKLHINQTTNGGQLATVQVEEDGLYRVTIFPMYGDTGIVKSGVGYSKQFVLLQATSSENTFPVLVVAGAAVLAVFLLIVLGTCLILCYSKIKNRSMTSPTGTSTDVKPPVPIYEEIGDSPGAFKFTQCPVYGLSPDVLMNEDSKEKP